MLCYLLYVVHSLLSSSAFIATLSLFLRFAGLLRPETANPVLGNKTEIDEISVTEHLQ